MIAVRQRLARYRHAAMILLAFAFAIRALIPQGMMAAHDGGRGVAVLMCDGTGVAGRVDLPMGETHGKTGQTEVCPFGMLAHVASPGAPDTWTVASLRPHAAIPATAQVALILGASSGDLPPARAPPAPA